MAERQRQALELRRRGLTYAVIARHLGYSNRAGAYKAIDRALRATLQEPADALRGLESERLDALHHSLWPAALAGDLKAVDSVLAIMRRRAKLLGLDAPKRTELSGDDVLARLVAWSAASLGTDPAALMAEARRLWHQFEREGM